MSFVFFCSHRPSGYPRTRKNGCEKPWVYSNWYIAPYTNGGVEYTCVEQEMMHRKALLFGDTASAAAIMSTNDQKTIKALGRAVSGFDESVWNDHKRDIVYNSCKAKFEQHKDLYRAMMSAQGTFVEASQYDRVWGIGYRANTAVENFDRWGQNLLGKTLTRIRDEFIHKRPSVP